MMCYLRMKSVSDDEGEGLRLERRKIKVEKMNRAIPM